jgi:hypothetical protein
LRRLFGILETEVEPEGTKPSFSITHIQPIGTIVIKFVANAAELGGSRINVSLSPKWLLFPPCGARLGRAFPVVLTPFIGVNYDRLVVSLIKAAQELKGCSTI